MSLLKLLNTASAPYLWLKKNAHLGKNHSNLIRKRFSREPWSLQLKEEWSLILNRSYNKKNTPQYFSVNCLVVQIKVK